MDKGIKLKDYFLEQFKKSRKSCTDEMYKNFIDYFDRKYSDRINKYITNDFIIYSIVQELEDLFKLSDLEVQKKITLDPEFEKIIDIRKKIVNIRVNSDKNNTQECSNQELDGYINLLNDLKNHVLSFNKEDASIIYCDCLIDIDYIKNKNNKTKSL